MRATLLIVLGLLLNLPAAVASEAFSKDPSQVTEVLRKAHEEIRGANIYECIDRITNDPPFSYRLMNTPPHDMFVQKYAKVFSSLSPKIKDQVVHFAIGGSNAGGTGAALPDGGDNIIGVLPGKDLTRWVVLGGHYDTREATLGGAAIDNTSGICTVKEIARAIIALGIEPEVTIVFAWWDGEEWGLYGARAFVADHNETKKLLGLSEQTPVQILMAHSYDIVGINYPAYNTWLNYGEQTNILEYAVLNLRTAPIGENNFTLCPNYGCYTRLQERDDFESHVLPGFIAYNGLVREVTNMLGLPDAYVQVRDDKYGRSDHVPFIAAGIPGMRIQGSHDGQWPHYHQPTDTLPAAVTMAGGIDRLQAGFDTAAGAGGLTAIYAAITGGLGTYGAAPLEAACGVVQDVSGECPPAVAAQPMPAPGLILFLAALLIILTKRRSE